MKKNDFCYCNTGKCPKKKKCERHVCNHYFEADTVIPIMTVEYYGKNCPMFVHLIEVFDL